MTRAEVLRNLADVVEVIDKAASEAVCENVVCSTCPAQTLDGECLFNQLSDQVSKAWKGRHNQPKNGREIIVGS